MGETIKTGIVSVRRVIKARMFAQTEIWFWTV
jgi:hypothetical protein